MATMQDVAERAGVSKSTVSRVLSGKAQISVTTRQAVLQAIDELGFRPNILAQALANQCSNTLGLVVSDFEGPYFGRLLRTMAQRAESAGKQLIVTDGHDDPEREKQALQLLVDRCCDAILLYSRYMPESELVELVDSVPVPLVVMNRPVPGHPERCVVFDQIGATRAAVAQLIQAGHEHIACISGPLRTLTARTRLEGFRTALQAANLIPDEALIIEGDNTIKGGYEACRQLLAKGTFSALFACNDDMAIGALRALQESGLTVPGQVSLVGFDDEPAAAFLTPSLSTVHIPVEEMCVAAMDQALRLAAGSALAPIAPFQGQVRVRESVCPRK